MSSEMFEKGKKIRIEVLGAQRVTKLLDGADDFNRPFQELVTEYCWGRCWGGDGLSAKQRSLLNIGILAALNRADEFELHVKAGIGNGLSLDEIQAALIQVTIYCGVPTGVEAFRLASRVIAALRESGALPN